VIDCHTHTHTQPSSARESQKKERQDNQLRGRSVRVIRLCRSLSPSEFWSMTVGWPRATRVGILGRHQDGKDWRKCWSLERRSESQRSVTLGVWTFGAFVWSLSDTSRYSQNFYRHQCTLAKTSEPSFLEHIDWTAVIK